MRRTLIFAGLAALAVGLIPVARLAAPAHAQGAKPAVEGKWTGTWGLYNPAQADKPSPYPKAQMKLDCAVEYKDGKWQATFEGECGKPYKYTIKMLGRQAGNIVLFQGTADLGPEDGGVFDWIGRATDKEFVGFYTCQKYTGTFTLARPKAEAKPASN